jgi:hypothetical protein
MNRSSLLFIVHRSAFIVQAAGNDPHVDVLSSTAALPAQVAQLVEQRTENPRVGGSIPSLGTTSFLSVMFRRF